MYKTSLLVFTLVASTLALPAAAELTANSVDHPSCQVWGQIAGARRLIEEGLDIELINRNSAPAPREKAQVLANGNFDFPAVPAGQYQFRVTDKSGAILLEETKALGGNNDFVLLVLPDPKRQMAAAAGVASLQSLQHRSPSRAWDAFRAARKAYSAGDTVQTVQ